MKKNFTIISLGCSKNLVDSEQIVYIMKENKYKYTQYLDEAEICIINTCGFIEDAKKESIDTILNVVDYKKEANLKYIIVTGCLSQRYYKELKEEIPEIDAFLGTTSFPLIANLIDGLYLGESKSLVLDANTDFDFSLKRNLLTESYYAYIKIAEGCDNKCTYCIIPRLRGSYKSRKIEDILTEIETYANKGVKEFILIAQDTSKYGADLYGKNSLSNLLCKISQIKNVQWIRFLYTYPEDVDIELVNSIKNNDKIVPYFDIPIQHCNNKILKLMNRNVTKSKLIEKINLIRSNLPNAIIRTTIMVGFPGETDEDYRELENFIKEVKFDRLGVFEYSDEENTAAFNLSDKVSEETKAIRKNRLMNIQKTISEKLNKKYIGNNYKVIVDEVYPDYLIGRGYMDVIDVDGVIYIESDSSHKIGDFIEVKIIDSMEYDLLGKEI